MVWVDWLLAVLLVLSTLIGLWRGLVREVLSISVWVVAIWLGLKFSAPAAGALADWIEHPPLRVVAGFAAIALGVLLSGGLLIWLIGRLVDASGLSGTDRLFGLLFGLVRGVLIAVVAVVAAKFTPLPEAEWWQQSAMLPYFEQISAAGTALLPEDFRRRLEGVEAGAPVAQPLRREPVAADLENAGRVTVSKPLTSSGQDQE